MEGFCESDFQLDISTAQKFCQLPTLSWVVAQLSCGRFSVEKQPRVFHRTVHISAKEDHEKNDNDYNNTNLYIQRKLSELWH